jgi:hypothetical protein
LLRPRWPKILTRLGNTGQLDGALGAVTTEDPLAHVEAEDGSGGGEEDSEGERLKKFLVLEDFNFTLDTSDGQERNLKTACACFTLRFKKSFSLFFFKSLLTDGQD